MVASVLNPRSSARSAQAGRIVPGAFGMGFGRPMPIFMNAQLNCAQRVRPADGHCRAVTACWSRVLVARGAQQASAELREEALVEVGDGVGGQSPLPCP